MYSNNNNNREDEEEDGPRRPIPVSTVSWQSTVTSHIIPLNGLDFLRDVNKLVLQQIVELTELVSYVGSDNRYAVKIPGGETIFYGTEYSSNFQRTCFGSGRAFTLRLFDHSQQEVVQFRRTSPFGCNLLSYCSQKLEMWTPPGQYAGCVQQELNIGRPRYSIYDKNSALLYRISGPRTFCCFIGDNPTFQIYNPEFTTQIGSIINQWDQMQVAYNLLIQLPAARDCSHKALLLGAAFLLQYMYFENPKGKPNFRCMC